MIRLLKFFLTGDWHLHSWKVLYDREIIVKEVNGYHIIYNHPPVLQCEHCGKVKDARPPVTPIVK